MKNNKGVLTPQGAFDLNPEQFMLEHMDPDEYEYLGLENKGAESKRDNKFAAAFYHKINIKPRLLKTLVEGSIAIDSCYIPINGKVVTYTYFYAAVCKTKSGQKMEQKIEKEKQLIARDNTLAQLIALEKVALSNADILFEAERAELNLKREQLERVVTGLGTSSEEIQNLNLSKDINDHKRRELDVTFSKAKTAIIDKFISIRSLREVIDNEKARQAEDHNLKRRQKRVLEKSKRMKADNGIDMASQAVGTLVGITTPEVDEVVIALQNDEEIVNNILESIVVDIEQGQKD